MVRGDGPAGHDNGDGADYGHGQVNGPHEFRGVPEADVPGIHLGADAVIAEVGDEQTADDAIDGFGDEHGKRRQRHVGSHFVFRSYPRHIFGEAGREEQFPECEYQDLRHNGYQIRLGARFNAGDQVVPFNGNGHENERESGDGHARNHEANGREAAQHRNEQDEAGDDDGRVDGIDGAYGKVVI